MPLDPPADYLAAAEAYTAAVTECRTTLAGLTGPPHYARDWSLAYPPYVNGTRTELPRPTGFPGPHTRTVISPRFRDPESPVRVALDRCHTLWAELVAAYQRVPPPARGEVPAPQTWHDWATA